jgi:hypothetical protein
MQDDSNMLRGFIYAHWGGYKQLGELLGLATSTITGWAHTQPRNMLKYAPEIVGSVTQMEYAQLVEAVMSREQQLVESSKDPA